MANSKPRTRKVALVTGCDSPEGIGQALCRELVTRGLLVFATGLSLEAMAQLHDYAPEQIRTMVMDVTSEAQVDEIVATVVAEVDGIDLLINNAGIAALTPSIEVDLAVARRVHEVNFWGTWATCKAAGRHMVDRRRGGVIVNVGSMASRGHPPFTAPYNTSKAATESLSHSLRLELAPYGVAVVYVAPTWCRTAIVTNSLANVASEAQWRAGRYGAIREQVVRESSAPELLPCAWPPARIARRIVDAALRNRPPTVVYGGGQYRVLGFLTAWMPRWFVDWVIFHKSGLARLARLVAAPLPAAAAAAGAVDGDGDATAAAGAAAASH